MLLTKHCRPIDRDRMLSGSFKIGSHAEYSKAEGDGLLSDDSEGQWSDNIKGNLRNANFVYNGIIFKNMNIEHNGTTLRFDKKINSSIFCCSCGIYDPVRHDKILNGFELYKPNNEVTAYVVISRFLFLEALNTLIKEMKINNSFWINGRVNYGERKAEVEWSPELDTNGFINNANKEILAAFTKPSVFSVEDEYRFVSAEKLNEDEYVLTGQFSDVVKSAFKRSILYSDIGSPSFDPAASYHL